MVAKTAGCILVLTATTAWGAKAACELGQCYEQARQLELLMVRLRSEMLYARTCLGDVFLSLEKEFPDPFPKWMSQMCREMEKRQGTAFFEIWRDSVTDCLADSGLLEKDRIRLSDLGSQLGEADLEIQIRAIDLYLEEFRRSMEEMRKEMKNKQKLFRCMGIMSGLFITVFLI